jgi:predicted permease
MPLTTLAHDVRFGLRMLLKSRTVTAIAVLSLALGIGATTAIFSLVNVFFLKSVPVADPERVVFIFGTDARKAGAAATWNYFPMSYPNFIDIRDQVRSFTDVASFVFIPVNLGSETGAPERSWGQLVNGNYFRLLGVKAALGRTFLPEEDGTLGAHPVVVLSHALWQRRYGGDASWVGRTLLLNGRPFTVVGITPPGFQGPTSVGGTELWIPMAMRYQMLASAEDAEHRRWRQFTALGRLRPGVELARAETEMKTIASRLEQEYPAENEGRGLTLLPITEAGLNPNDRSTHLRAGGLLLGAVALVLLIACANVANLLLSRSLARGREIAVRLAQGARRAHLVRQLLVESLLLFVVGGGLGLLFGIWMRDLLWGIRPPLFAFLDPTIDLRLDRNVLAFSFALSLGTGLLFGLVPALQASRKDLIVHLRESAPGAERGQTGGRVRDVLVIGQISLSLVALVGAGLFVRSLRNFERVEPGFETRDILQLTISLDGQSYPEGRVRDYHRRVVETVEALPQVASASLANSRLMSPFGVMMRTFLREGLDDATGKGGSLIRTDIVDLRYFDTAGIPRLQGRDFTAFDDAGKPAVAVINAMAARHLWPGEPALGKRFSIFGETEPIEVIGVVGDIRSGTLSAEPEPIVYLPLRQRFIPGVSLLVRTNGPPASALLPVRQAVQDLDRSLPLIDVETIAESREASLWAPRIGAALLSAFGLLAVAMAVVGLYGVTSHGVEQRRRELAIRVALGAGRREIVGLVLRRTAKVVGAGLAVGLIVALLFARVISSFLYGVGAADPPTFALILVLLAVVALAASLLPARRATRVQAGAVLRSA